MSLHRSSRRRREFPLRRRRLLLLRRGRERGKGRLRLRFVRGLRFFFSSDLANVIFCSLNRTGHRCRCCFLSSPFGFRKRGAVGTRGRTGSGSSTRLTFRPAPDLSFHFLPPSLTPLFLFHLLSTDRPTPNSSSSRCRRSSQREEDSSRQSSSEGYEGEGETSS